MSNAISSNLANLLADMGVFTLEQSTLAGVSQSTVSRLTKSGVIQKLGSGIYKHAEAKVDIPNIMFTIACNRFGPESVISGRSALHFYGLMERQPDKIWVVVPTEVRCTDTRYRLIRTSRKFRIGMVDHGPFRISSPDRALLESLIFSTKVGPSIVRNALKIAIKKGIVTLGGLETLAKDMQCNEIFKKNFLPKYLWSMTDEY